LSFSFQIIVTDVIESPDFGTGHSVIVSDPGLRHIETILQHNLNMGITATKVGMYHSHPKLGVFLSQVDVQQNRRGQLFGDEHVSIVIDSIESVETGRLEIGAFRR
jgi:COP9 signalosome complex subunit 5